MAQIVTELILANIIDVRFLGFNICVRHEFSGSVTLCMVRYGYDNSTNALQQVAVLKVS